MKTPIEEIIEKLNKGLKVLEENGDIAYNRGLKYAIECCIVLLKESLEKEKKVIIEAYQQGRNNTTFFTENEKIYERAEEYYNKTFNK
jgi:hypothetical protein